MMMREERGETKGIYGERKVTMEMATTNTNMIESGSRGIAERLITTIKPLTR
jgi:hypothetical protein